MLPGLPLYGLFEPTFHETAPDYARVYGVPYEWITRHGLRRYGFHGASHRHIAERAPERLGRPAHDLRLVSCHLGGSSSVCAIRSGASIDTSMGLTPQSGLMQSSRSGDLDPFGVLMVMDREGWTTDEMRRALCRESGLKGLSGVGSGDMRDLLEAEKQGNDRARLAVQAFTYEIKKYIGAYAAALGGVDALVFTGGMGERSAEIRRRVCEGLDFLGINLDHRLNNALDGEGIISPSTAPVSVLVIPANEERIIACEVIKALERA
jgi:acetate kinase